MDGKEFIVYSDRNQLRTLSTTEYRVKKLLKPKELKQSIKDCKEELDLEGAKSIFKNFDKLFSIIEFIEQIDYDNLHYTYEKILVRSLNIIGSFFSSYGDIEDLQTDLRYDYRNIIKMTVYLFVEFVHSFNMKIETDYKILLLETKGRNKKQDMILKHTSDYNWNWENKLSDGFKAINSIISYNITHLYDPPYIDHNFVLYIASCCYTQLENPSISFVRTKNLRDSIMQILLIFITDYDHAQEFKIKVVKLLKLYEHLSLPLAKLVLQVIESGNNRSSLIKLIVKEMAESVSVSNIKETNNQEITGGKSCCAFLVEIAKQCPEILLPNIDYLLPCLESEPYTMRICVLSVLKELVICVLNYNQLDKSRTKIRNYYLSILYDHLLDINAFVRSKVLQLFIVIINHDCLPKDMYVLILKCGEEKLRDKSSYVTKSAIQLIKTLIKLNPFSCDFTEEQLQMMIKNQNCILKFMEQVLEDKLNDEMWPSIEPLLKSFLENKFESHDLESFYEIEILENMKLSEVLRQIKHFMSQHKFDKALKFVLCSKETFKDELLFKLQDENNLSEQFFFMLKNIWCYKNAITLPVLINIEEYEYATVEDIHRNIYNIQTKIEHLQNCFDYMSTTTKSLNTINELLFGNTTSESLEAIDFFTTAFQFGVPHSETGINSMLPLIYSNETSIKDAMMNSYKTIYLGTDDIKDSTIRVANIMTKLIHLVKILNLTRRKAFKILINKWIQNNTLDDDYVMLLWAWFTKSTVINEEDRVAASLMLSLLTDVKPSIAIGNLDSLIQHGLCDNSFQLFIYSCQILQQIPKENVNELNIDNELIRNIFNVTHRCFKECKVEMFNYIALNAISIIYKLAADPENISEILLLELYINCNENDVFEHKTIDSNIDFYAKFLFAIGQIALQQCHYLENVVIERMINDVRTKYEKKRLTIKSKEHENNLYESEAAEIERVNDRIKLLCDKKTVYGSGLLSSFSKCIADECSSNNFCLKSNAILTLTKYMLVSVKFCQKHLPLFVDILEKSDNFEITIDMIVGFGWLVFRHPNLMEPYTDYLYARLKEKHVKIRYCALMTIIDLIKQEMIKVRGQVAAIARLLVDENEKINSTVRFFFKVIAERGNTLYNVISDIISILSNPEDAIPENDFQEIMKYLFPLINKERQIESLVDKFCIRLKESFNDNQAYYISYCLTIIKYTDKSLTKLSDNFSYYSDKLKYPKVYNNFNILINNNSRTNKPATKDILTELSKKIEKIVKDENFAILHTLKTPRKRLTTIKKKTLKSTKIKNEKDPLQVATKETTRCHTKVKRRLIIIDSEEEENSEEFADTSGVSNIQTTVPINSNEEFESDIDNLAQQTRTNTAKSIKKKLRISHKP